MGLFTCLQELFSKSTFVDTGIDTFVTKIDRRYDECDGHEARVFLFEEKTGGWGSCLVAATSGRSMTPGLAIFWGI